MAAAFWATAVGLALSHKDDPVRSLSQGVAVTTTVIGAVLWAMARLTRRNVRVSSPEGATYISANALLDPSPITVELPRQRPEPERELAMSGSPQRRSQDFWDGVSSFAETFFERRDDDPEPS